jgi:hypothetical protein
VVPTDVTRRRFLALAAGGASLALLGCGTHLSDTQRLSAQGAGTPPALDSPEDEAPPVLSVPVTPPVIPPGRDSRLLLQGTPWETPLVIAHSGQPGPAVLVLGGVHGNEPGAWMAADQVSQWLPKAGTLLISPRTNTLAIAAGQRTLDSLGDLNRLYPGNPSPKSLPMSRMASVLTDLCADFGVQLLYDMHESWAFFAERGTTNGNAYLGQTVSLGAGNDNTLHKDLVAKVNPKISAKRDKLNARTEIPPVGVVATNSLGVGRYVSGITSLLVEMGQDRQDVAKRVDLHVLTARTMLQMKGML